MDLGVPWSLGPVDIGIHTQYYADHAHTYIQPEFILPLRNGRQEAKFVFSSEHAHFKCQRARCSINNKKKRESLLTSARLLFVIYCRFLDIVASFLPPYKPYTTLSRARNSDCEEPSRWPPRSQLTHKMPAMEPQTREFLSS